MLIYTGCLSTLSEVARVKVLALSARNQNFEEVWKTASASVEKFPAIRPFKEFPYNYPLRRFNESGLGLPLTSPQPDEYDASCAQFYLEVVLQGFENTRASCG